MTDSGQSGSEGDRNLREALRRLPMFPLPNVVLFPNVFLPLHIFEPRYRDMVADAVAGVTGRELIPILDFNEQDQIGVVFGHDRYSII